MIATLCVSAIAATAHAETVRVATFNLALYGQKSGEILARLQTGVDPQARALAEIIQRARPEVLVLNEIDYDDKGEVLAAFCDRYLAVGQNVSQSPEAAEPIDFPHRMAFATNTGEHTGLDLDRNGMVDVTLGNRNYGADCYGYGVYPGQYAFAVLSRFPIDRAHMRTFRKFLWKDMPQARLPDDPATPAPADWYSPEILTKFRLSSKNHCDVPIDVDGRVVHLLLSHPTPPVFDGPEDRNGCRNHDELRFWVDYIASSASPPLKGRDQLSTVASGDRAQGGSLPPGGTPEASTSESPSDYIYDDNGRRGGILPSNLQPPASSLQPAFIILGDLNGDPHDGQGKEGIAKLLASPHVLKYPAPTSKGAVEAAKLQGGANVHHVGNPAEDTEDPADDPGPGNLRLDYILPSANLRVAASVVFWPETPAPLYPLIAGAEHPASSDHRLVWVDVDLGAAEE